MFIGEFIGSIISGLLELVASFVVGLIADALGIPTDDE